MAILTNATTGGQLIGEVSSSAWALQHFLDLTNPPAAPKQVSRDRLSAYEGRYKTAVIPPGGSAGKMEPLSIQVRARNGELKVTGDVELSLAFYRDDFVVATSPDGQAARSDFVRGSDNEVAWFRDRGRLYRRET